MIKTTSLETSKLLKENGFRQDNSENYYTDVDGAICLFNCPGIIHESFAAPTTDELLEELPEEYDNGSLCMTRKSVYYEIYEPYEPAYIKHCFDGKNLVEACAKAWLYLKKEGLNAR